MTDVLQYAAPWAPPDARRTAAPVSPARYAVGDGQLAALRQRIRERLGEVPGGGGARAATKAALSLGWLAATWAFLVFAAAGALQVALGTVSLGLATVSVGLNIMHDGNHGSFSRSGWLNRLAGFCADLVGASSYIWRHKHYLHHHFPNVEGVDSDIEHTPFLRLAPWQARRGYHRFQHLYAWPLYGLMLVKWNLVDDFRELAKRRIGHQALPLPRGVELALLIAGKGAFVTLAFVVPLHLHDLPAVAAVYLSAAAVTGTILAVTFQGAHCVEHTRFAEKPANGDRLQRTWMEQQVVSTVNFSLDHPLVAWFFGGMQHLALTT